MNKDSLKRTVYVISISLLIIAVLVVFFSLAFMERSRRQAIYDKAMEYIEIKIHLICVLLFVLHLILYCLYYIKIHLICVLLFHYL